MLGPECGGPQWDPHGAAEGLLLVSGCAAACSALTAPPKYTEPSKLVCKKGNNVLAPLTSPQHVPATSSLPPPSRAGVLERFPVARKRPFHQTLLFTVTYKRSTELNVFLPGKLFCSSPYHTCGDCLFFPVTSRQSALH